MPGDAGATDSSLDWLHVVGIVLIGAMVVLLGVLVGALLVGRATPTAATTSCCVVSAPTRVPQPEDKGLVHGRVLNRTNDALPGALVEVWHDALPANGVDPTPHGPIAAATTHPVTATSEQNYSFSFDRYLETAEDDSYEIRFFAGNVSTPMITHVRACAGLAICDIQLSPALPYP